MRPRWPGLIPLALCAFSPALLPVVTPSLAHAAGDGPATAVLGLESSDVPASVVDAISEELRQRVSAASDMRLVSGKDLVELKLVFSCADEGHACMAQAGKSLDADRLIYGSVKKDGNDVAVWLKSFDVHHERVDNWLTDKLPGKQTDADGIRTAVARWFAKLTGHPTNVGTILVSANTLGAVVTLDGVPAGVTSDQPLAIPDVKPGAHHLLLTKVGSAPARQDLAVQAGQTLTVNLALHPEGMAVVAGSEAGGTIRKSGAGAAGGGFGGRAPPLGAPRRGDLLNLLIAEQSGDVLERARVGDSGKYDLGAVVLMLTLAFAAWGLWKMYEPRKRQHGMRIKLSVAKPDEDKRDSPEP